MPHWNKIVIHDSYDKKGVRRSSDEILDFHLGWKDIEAGEPIPEPVAMHLIDQGESGISRPWKECGDHWHVVQGESGRWHVRMMRPMTANGVHSKDTTLNRSAISVRICPYSDPVMSDELVSKLIVLCKFLMKVYHIAPDHVYAHYERSVGSDCPRAWFMIEKFRAELIRSLFK